MATRSSKDPPTRSTGAATAVQRISKLGGRGEKGSDSKQGKRNGRGGKSALSSKKGKKKVGNANGRGMHSYKREVAGAEEREKLRKDRRTAEERKKVKLSLASDSKAAKEVGCVLERRGSCEHPVASLFNPPCPLPSLCSKEAAAHKEIQEAELKRQEQENGDRFKHNPSRQKRQMKKRPKYSDDADHGPGGQQIEGDLPLEPSESVSLT